VGDFFSAVGPTVAVGGLSIGVSAVTWTASTGGGWHMTVDVL
jgi:hypothetical protein